MALTFAFAMPANAQFAFGIKGGLNLVNNEVSGLTSMTKEEFFSQDTYKGFFIGTKMEFDIPFAGLGFEVAALYSQRGLIAPTNETIKYNSVLLPVNLRLGFGLGNLLKVFLAAGPEFDFNIGENTQFVSGSREQGIVAYAVNKSALSINVGVNYNIPWGSTYEAVSFSRSEIQEIEKEEGPVNSTKTLTEQYEELRTKYNAAHEKANKTVDDITEKVKAGTLQLSLAVLF